MEEYQRWLTHEGHTVDIRAELMRLSGDEQAIEERFHSDLSFGTGGLRGILGAGTNRINIFTVRKASFGLARYLLSNTTLNARQRGVVIGYDCRHMSPEFALETGLVLAGAGIRAYVFEYLCPTPELSYAVRELGCAAGVMITASHNPPEYNGYKVYDEHGGQILPDVADAISLEIAGVRDVFTIDRLTPSDAMNQGLLTWVGAQLDKSYVSRVVSEVKTESVQDADRARLRVVYSPLHGTGFVPVSRVMKDAGYTQFHVVETQAEPDGDFSTVKSPNPEEQSAFEHALELAKTVSADLVLATDPDADRVGAAVRTAAGDYVFLTGNQTGGLLIDFLLQERTGKFVPSDSVLLKTIVTSDFGAAIARAAGLQVENTLTGFKFIGGRIRDHEYTGDRRFFFGYEESYGYLAAPFARDKDAVQACLLIAEMAARYHREGLTLVDRLHALYEQVGFYREELVSRTLPGQDGVAQIQTLMTRLRMSAGDQFGSSLQTLEDYLTSERVSFKDRSRASIDMLTLPKSDVMKYLFADGSWLAVRPSGTEPKIKIYLAARGTTADECDRSMANLRQIALDILQE